jgi:putative Holliday junction resolvase
LQAQNRRILGLDVGDKRIGVAVSDPLGITAQPLETYVRVGYGPDARHFAALGAQYGAELALCGLPRNMDGSLGGQAEKVRAFAAELEKAGLPVAYWDERLTTVTAERALLEGGMRRDQRKQVVDKVAAAIILQAYLDAGAPGANRTPKEEEEESTMDNEETVIELVNEFGEPEQFVHLMTLEHEGETYVLLASDDSSEEEDDECEVYIMRIDQDDHGEDCYKPVEDEVVLQAVFDKFVAISEQDEEDSDEAD